MNLFLTSYLVGTRSLVKTFLSQVPVREIMFIPTAANVEDYRGYVDEAISVFEELGYRLKMLDIASIEQDKVVEALENCHCLYVSGGNTFYLLQELKRKDLCPIIARKVAEGMPYIGESAGAIVTAPDIDYCHLMDDKSLAEDLRDYTGLGICQRYVLPHYGEFPFADCAEAILSRYQQHLPLVPLNNQQALIVEGDNYTVKNEG